MKRQTIMQLGLLAVILTAPAANAERVSTDVDQTNSRQTQKARPLQNQLHLLSPKDIGFSQAVSKMPPDSPVPVYGGSTFVSANQVNATQGSQFFGRYNARAPIDSVASWYEQALKADGWIMMVKPQKDSTGAYGMAAFKERPRVGCSIRLDSQNGTDRNNRVVQSTNIGISVTTK